LIGRAEHALRTCLKWVRHSAMIEPAGRVEPYRLGVVLFAAATTLRRPILLVEVNPNARAEWKLIALTHNLLELSRRAPHAIARFAA
jgi:hypothetical protein